MSLNRERVLVKLRRNINIYKNIIYGLAGVLILMSFFLQIVKGSYYYDLSLKNSIRTYPIFGSRGIIYDRDGNILAENYPTHDLYVIGEDLFKGFDGDVKDHKVYKFLVEDLKLDPVEVEQRLKSAMDSPYQPVLIKKDLEEWRLAKVESLNWSIPGLYVEVGEKRYYPYGPIFAHVVGYVGEANKEEVSNYYYLPGEFVGRDGIERYYETYLRGVGG